jgi:hypothetical protein
LQRRETQSASTLGIRAAAGDRHELNLVQTRNPFTLKHRAALKQFSMSFGLLLAHKGERVVDQPQESCIVPCEPTQTAL